MSRTDRLGPRTALSFARPVANTKLGFSEKLVDRVEGVRLPVAAVLIEVVG